MYAAAERWHLVGCREEVVTLGDTATLARRKSDADRRSAMVYCADQRAFVQYARPACSTIFIILHHPSDPMTLSRSVTAAAELQCHQRVRDDDALLIV